MKKKFLLPNLVLALLVFSTTIAHAQPSTTHKGLPALSQVKEKSSNNAAAPSLPVAHGQNTRSRTSTAAAFIFNNPAGCAAERPSSVPTEMLANVQAQLGTNINLNDRRIAYVWNGEAGTKLDTTDNTSAFEFRFNEFQAPFTYKADQVVTIFLQNGFAVWLRSYDGDFRLLAVPMNADVQGTVWGNYVTAYWQKDSKPNDSTIVPVSKKLPCQWMIAEGIVSNQTLSEMFDLAWQMPDYTAAGNQYLASNCQDAQAISQEKIGYWDATSMCGPLTWQINHDANAFPYRIGSYDADASLFINANPRYWYGRPWNGFDPETFDLVVETGDPMPHYDFAGKGNLYTGDIIFSYATSEQYTSDDGRFSHIFMVTSIDRNGARHSITNMVKTQAGVSDCSISDVILYTPGDTETGVINYEWDNHGYGFTGRHGFDVFRWKWITYHNEGTARQYTVRWGETLETIGFDWKVAPLQVAQANGISVEQSLSPGQVITLPAP